MRISDVHSDAWRTTKAFAEKQLREDFLELATCADEARSAFLRGRIDGFREILLLPEEPQRNLTIDI